MVSAGGEVSRAIGDPTTKVMLRSTVKPFGVVALIESGAADAFGLTTEELAVMAASHAGEDKHVRTLQAIFRRANVTQTLLRCGTTGAPADMRTAARLARDGETPGPLRHGCSGYHAACILMSVHAGWSLDDYVEPRHPSQVALRETVARLLGRSAASLKSGLTDCGMATFQVSLIELARAYLLLAAPEGPAVSAPQSRSAAALTRIRDAMLASPDMVGGTFDMLDTELMRRRPGLVVSKGGGDGLLGLGLVSGDGDRGVAPAGLAIKIDDGDASRRAMKAVSVEVLAQIGVLDSRDLRALESLHHPGSLTPDGAEAATTVARFELAPLDELA